MRRLNLKFKNMKSSLSYFSLLLTAIFFNILIGCKKESIQTQTNLTNGLMAYYPFNGNANDESGNGNSAAINGAVLVNDRFGNSNSSYKFTANSDIISTSSSSLKPQVLSVSLWFIINSPWSYTTLNLFSIYKDSNTLTGGFVIRLDQNDTSYGVGNYKIYCAINDANIASLTVASPSYTFSQLNRWNNLIVTKSDTQINIYLNGIVVKNQDVSGSIDYANTVLQIGNKRNINSNPLGVRIIDDVRLYNRVITQDEISYLARN